MLSTELSASATLLKHRHIGAIAALVLISLLISLSGSPIHHTIANSWEGFLWGMADPVMNLDCLVSVITIGLFSANICRGAFIAASFVFAAVFGTIIHLLQLNLAGAEIAIAISVIAFGMMLVISKQLNWVLLAFLGATTGFFHGSAHGELIIGAEIVPLVTYVLGATLTQSVLVMSAREINPILLSKIHFAGLAFCALGIVFLHNSIA
ncbi:HupE/UreJ family protein [Calothrix sp. PCC 7507]|uniref:HupE/UreJ family protein n=1 Tax=Calothrix sp. PCC 7507 TaxID=99598 RepID=UPI00029ECFCB|nr:HupE/UreJ family protein [Calothrix sp. PCC 7507]AFY33838.1 hydrogenase accessory protein [Calothrix sp. PCC 7507]